MERDGERMMPRPDLTWEEFLFRNSVSMLNRCCTYEAVGVNGHTK